MQSDPDLPDINIGNSHERMLGTLAGSVALALFGAATAFGWLPESQRSGIEVAAGYCGLVFFGFSACVIGWKLLWSGRPVLVISRHGIRDARYSNILIPWQSVQEIYTWQVRRQYFVVFKLGNGQTMSEIEEAAVTVNRTLGVDGIPISTATLTINAVELVRICGTYLAAARATNPPIEALPSM